MSTTIGYVVDAVDASYSLDVYTGVGGIALLIHGPVERPAPSKFWLSDDGAQKLVHLLQELNMPNETNADRRGRQRDALPHGPADAPAGDRGVRAAGSGMAAGIQAVSDEAPAFDVERFMRVPPVYRFVNQKGQPVPPFGFHFPWDGNPNHCAMCERGPEELSNSQEPCDAPGVGRR